MARRSTLLCLALVAAACGVLSPEEQLLTDFFEASRLHDTTVVARMSDVIFNPRVDGIVDAFDVERVEELPDGQSERVTVNARVRMLSGESASRTIEFTLTRRADRWFISGIE